MVANGAISIEFDEGGPNLGRIGRSDVGVTLLPYTIELRWNAPPR